MEHLNSIDNDAGKWTTAYFDYESPVGSQLFGLALELIYEHGLEGVRIKNELPLGDLILIRTCEYNEDTEEGAIFACLLDCRVGLDCPMPPLDDIVNTIFRLKRCQELGEGRWECI